MGAGCTGDGLNAIYDEHPADLIAHLPLDRRPVSLFAGLHKRGCRVNFWRSLWGANRRRWMMMPARRLRVPRGSGADPLNLIQVMLAKG